MVTITDIPLAHWLTVVFLGHKVKVISLLPTIVKFLPTRLLLVMLLFRQIEHLVSHVGTGTPLVRRVICVSDKLSHVKDFHFVQFAWLPSVFWLLLYHL